MASNTLPTSTDSLFTLAEDMADGAHSYEAAIGLKQNTEANLRADLTAARAAQDAVDAAKQAKSVGSAAQTVADSNGKAFIALTKNALAPAFGSAWSADWGAVGFPDDSVAVPSRVADRQELLKSINLWLAANPAKEIAPLGFTGAAVGALQNRMRGMISELGQLLDDADPRWYAFGLNAPADPATPGIPDGLTLAAGAAGTVYADWADARRADGYRVYKQVTGVDAAFVKVATVTDSNATLTGLLSGKTVKVQVTATNAAGESQPSASVEIVVP